MVIYELHVKGFTMRHPGVPEPLRGRYMGLAHPEARGVPRSALPPFELMPGPAVRSRAASARGWPPHYWGYQPYAYFAPHAEYASDDRGSQVTEFKAMVKALHAAGLEVIYRRGYNHTAEGNHLGRAELQGIGQPRVITTWSTTTPATTWITPGPVTA